MKSNHKLHVLTNKNGFHASIPFHKYGLYLINAALYYYIIFNSTMQFVYHKKGRMLLHH